MHIQVDTTGTLDNFRSAIETVCTIDDVRSIAVFSCDANELSPQRVSPILTKVGMPLFGGIFPALINGSQKLERGTLVVGLPFDVCVHTIDGLSDPGQDFDSILDDLLPAMDANQTMLVFVDGFATRIGNFIEELFNTFGLDINYVGGGAGSLSMQSKPCLFTNQGVLQDCGLLIGAGVRSGIGVSHGWESIKGPYKVTEADHNRIISLDWTPAFEIYRQAVESHSGKSFDGDNYFELASAYPFGITKMSTERVVRDPVMVDAQGGLVCVGDVPEGSFVDILNGDNATLINAAATALDQAKKDFGPLEDAGLTFLMDCISRALFLDERFGEELDVVQDEPRPTVGVCSLGEIANSGRDYLEFYNKTCVVGILANK